MIMPLSRHGAFRTSSLAPHIFKFIMLAKLVVLFASFMRICGSVTHTVTVGVEGSFFNPPTISASLGDIIYFIFGGDFHSVTQSSFDSPCIRLPGGFDSGFQGRGPTFIEPTPTWSITITNISQPIWFFCAASVPTSHCESGMVGVINPPSIAMYEQFVSVAKAVTSTPKPTPTFLPSGQGAIATAPPMLSSLPLSSFASSASFRPINPSSSTTGTDATASSIASVHRKRINVGLIAGCATTGGLVILGPISFIYYFLTRRKLKSYHDDFREAEHPQPQMESRSNSGVASGPPASYPPIEKRGHPQIKPLNSLRSPRPLPRPPGSVSLSSDMDSGLQVTSTSELLHTLF
ncbi:hypothetical protein MIND_00940300 [Mycena indigotica]|uniref:Cupredoxin n=1 Tax=Mycena indigotica TaxID=2126181 RepID=A0A8H6VWX0_9AGAR|nr:uncharacterized protein MIND_00940300 [Mycena indigotica]KAF7297074.1 hypothetical protein MIND_00940300 [Mycena indigotica]